MRGYDPALDRHSAIKVLAPELAINAAARNRFAREAKSPSCWKNVLLTSSSRLPCRCRLHSRLNPTAAVSFQSHAVLQELSP